MNDIPNCFYRVSIKALVKDDTGRIMLSKNDEGQWEVPGGGLDCGERPMECLKRELKEELGLEVSQCAAQPVCFVTLKDKNGVWKAVAVYEVKLTHFDFVKSDECQELRFFEKEEALKENCHPMTVGVLREI